MLQHAVLKYSVCSTVVCLICWGACAQCLALALCILSEQESDVKQFSVPCIFNEAACILCMLVAGGRNRWSTLGPLAFLHKDTATLPLPSNLFPSHNPPHISLDSSQASN